MKQTIALIDDDRNILTSLSIALEKEGFKVQTYLDGESALIGLARTPPDLAVIDIKMPKMDGEELLKKLRKKTSLPVIFLTSKDDEIDELLGLKVRSFVLCFFFFFSSRRRHTRLVRDWSSDVCSSDLEFLPNSKLLSLHQKYNFGKAKTNDPVCLICI